MMVTKHHVSAERSEMAKKRTNGEGTIRQRETGLWECTIMDGFQPNGKRKYKSFYGNTQAEVKKKMKAYLKAKEEGSLAAQDYTFGEWAEIWFENHKSNITPTTQESYRHTLNRIKPFFSGRYIIEIKPYDIEHFLKAQRAQGLSDSYISGFRGMLYQIFHKAEANDLVRKNPVRFAEKMRSNGPKQRKEAFTAEEVKLLMQRLPYDKMGMSIRLMLGTGMRTQELLALEIASIHNLAFYVWLTQEARKHILMDDYASWKRTMLENVTRRL